MFLGILYKRKNTKAKILPNPMGMMAPKVNAEPSTHPNKYSDLYSGKKKAKINNEPMM